MTTLARDRIKPGPSCLTCADCTRVGAFTYDGAIRCGHTNGATYPDRPSCEHVQADPRLIERWGPDVKCANPECDHSMYSSAPDSCQLSLALKCPTARTLIRDGIETKP